MARRTLTCGQCRSIRRTSPTQVFLLCDWWLMHGGRSGADVLRCRVVPTQPACVHLVVREDNHLELVESSPAYLGAVS